LFLSASLVIFFKKSFDNFEKEITKDALKNNKFEIYN